MQLERRLTAGNSLAGDADLGNDTEYSIVRGKSPISPGSTSNARYSRNWAMLARGCPWPQMIACDCGWTLVSPAGDADIKKHATMHVNDAHTGMNVTDEQMKEMIKHI